MILIEMIRNGIKNSLNIWNTLQILLILLRICKVILDIVLSRLDIVKNFNFYTDEFYDLMQIAVFYQYILIVGKQYYFFFNTLKFRCIIVFCCNLINFQILKSFKKCFIDMDNNKKSTFAIDFFFYCLFNTLYDFFNNELCIIRAIQ